MPRTSAARSRKTTVGYWTLGNGPASTEPGSRARPITIMEFSECDGKHESGKFDLYRHLLGAAYSTNV